MSEIFKFILVYQGSCVSVAGFILLMYEGYLREKTFARLSFKGVGFGLYETYMWEPVNCCTDILKT